MNLMVLHNIQQLVMIVANRSCFNRAVFNMASSMKLLGNRYSNVLKNK